MVDDEQKLVLMIADLSSKVQTILDKQEELAENVTKIKEAVYNPDEGIYARLRELENWKKTSSRLIWLIITTSMGVLTAGIINYIWEIAK